MRNRKLNILTIGAYSLYGVSNTGVHRYESMMELGHNVDKIDMFIDKMGFAAKIKNRLFRYGFPVCITNLDKENQKIISAVKNKHYDILWFDKSLYVQAQTLRQIRQLQPNCLIVGYSPDDMNQRWNQSQQWLDSLAFYDFYFTTKSYNVDELKRLGCKNVYYIGNAYNYHFHHPVEIDDRMLLGGDVGFVGTYEKERSDYMSYIAENDINVRIWGNNWHNKYRLSKKMNIEYRPLTDLRYIQAICSFKINLCFLRKANRDMQTTRTMEIPACKAFMLAERTDEHLELFKEGIEAEFFDSKEELVDKCHYYLKHERERQTIAEAGFKRCQDSAYSNLDRVRQMLTVAQQYSMDKLL
jgi:spore maturation protein CgeB